MKQFSAVILVIAVLLIAAIVYVLTMPPKDVTLKDIIKVNPRPADTHTNTEVPDKEKTTLADSTENAGDDKAEIDYYIIIESVRNQIQAQQKAEKLIKNFNTEIIVLPATKEGYYRISFGKYSTLEEARSAITNIRRNIRSDAWIFSVKK